MPLYAMDKFGNVYQTAGLTEQNDTKVNHYAGLAETGSMVLGDLSPEQTKVNNQIRQNKAREQKQLMQLRQNQQRAFKKQQENKKRQEMMMAQQKRVRDARTRAQKNASMMRQIEMTKNPFAHYDQSVNGDPLNGYSEGKAMMTREDWANNGKKARSGKGLTAHRNFNSNGTMSGFGDKGAILNQAPVASDPGVLGPKGITITAAKPMTYFQMIKEANKAQGFPTGYRNQAVYESLTKWASENNMTLDAAEKYWAVKCVAFNEMWNPNDLRDPTQYYKTSGIKCWEKASMAGGLMPADIVKHVGQAAGSYLNSDLNPLMAVQRAAVRLPIIKDIYKGIDQLTGGFLSDIKTLTGMPSRVLWGEGISQAEFLGAMMTAFKVGAIIMSAGTISSLITNGANVLKDGPLGKTGLGKAVLGLAGGMTVASLGGKSVTKALEDTAVSEAKKYAASEVGKKNGAIAAVVASATVGSVAQGMNVGTPQSVIATAQAGENAAKIAEQTAIEKIENGVIDAVTPNAAKDVVNQAKDEAKKQIAKQFEDETGIPLDLASRVVSGNVPTQAEVKKRIEEESGKELDRLKQELISMPDKIAKADDRFKYILDHKEELIAKEIEKRENEIAKAKDNQIVKITKAREQLDNKLAEAKTLADQVTEARAKAMIADQAALMASDAEKKAKEAIRDEMMKQLAMLMMKLQGLDKDMNYLYDVVDFEQEMAAVEVAQIELGVNRGYGHPMLTYGLLTKRA